MSDTLRDFLVLDLETRESFGDVGGRRPERLTISLVGVYDAREGRERTFRTEELAELDALLRTASCVVGFNLFGFDYAVLRSALATVRPAHPLNPYHLPTTDLLAHLERVLGFRVSLDDVAAATLDRRKTGSGLEAIRLFQAGKWDALAAYCLDDVRLTRDLYLFGCNHGFIRVPTRVGLRRDVPVAWAPVPAAQARMF